MASLFILAGQSNMVGICSASKVENDQVPGVELYWEGQKTGFKGLPMAGPEYGFAMKIRKATSDPVKILKCAANGTSLMAWAPEWSEERAAQTENAPDGPMYARLVREFKAVLVNGDEVKAIIWMQGERDSKYKVAAESYLDNLIALVSRMRKDMANVPFILGRVNPPPRFAFRELVREAQSKASSIISDSFCVDTDDIPLKDDALHHTFEGAQTLGKKFADAYKAMRGIA